MRYVFTHSSLTSHFKLNEMKKIAVLLSGIVLMILTTFAQAKQQTKKDGKKVSVATNIPSARLKKDGTADKRFKKNKVGEKIPLKKDGTPDKRFKKNKNSLSIL